MWKLPAPPAALPWIVAAACAACIALGWWLRGGQVEAVEARGQARVAELAADYSRKLAAAEASKAAVLAAEIEKGRQADERYQAELDRLEAATRARPPRIVWVCPPADAGPVPAGGGGGPADPGEPAAATADAGGVGPDAGRGPRAVDLSGLDRVTDRAKQVSAQLVELQRRCAGG